MKISNIKLLYVLIIVIVLGIGISVIYWIFNKSSSQEPSLNITPITTTTSSTTPNQATSTQKTQTYRNTEFGFEFHYPEDWIIRTNISYNPFSKFDLTGAPSKKSSFIYSPMPPFIINIVTPDFVERQFFDLKNITSKTIIEGVEGLKYEYEEQNLSHITIILPLGQYKIILGTTKEYEDVFNQILASFKFLK